jgi:hypothetical protein
MNNADFRIKATAPDAPSSTGIAVLYTNGSGVLMTRLQNGESFQVGSRIYASGHPSATLITYSSAGVYGNAGTFTYTGHVIGQTGIRGTGYLLGTPHAWLPIRVRYM